jgi:hypothetical protein
LRDVNDGLKEQLRGSRSELKAARRAIHALQHESKHNSYDGSSNGDGSGDNGDSITDMVTAICDAHTPIGSQWPIVRALTRNTHGNYHAFLPSRCDACN